MPADAAFAAAGLAAAIVPIALVVLVLLAVVGGRREPDPGLERPRVLYLVSAAFAGLVVFVGGLVTLVAALVDRTTSDFLIEPEKDALLGDAIRAGIVAAIGLVVFLVHDRAADRRVGHEPSAGDRLWVRAQLFVAFVALLLLVGALMVTAFGALVVFAPDLANAPDRELGLRQFLPGAAVAAVSALVLATATGRARRVGTTAVTPIPAAVPVSLPAPDVPPPAPAVPSPPPAAFPPPRPAADVVTPPAPPRPPATPAAPPRLTGDVAFAPPSAPPPVPESGTSELMLDVDEQPVESTVEPEDASPPRPRSAPRKAAPRLRRARPLRPPEDDDPPPPPPPPA